MNVMEVSLSSPLGPATFSPFTPISPPPIASDCAPATVTDIFADKILARDAAQVRLSLARGETVVLQVTFTPSP